MAPTTLYAKTAVEDRMPDLLIGSQHTKSSALHRIRFIGELRQWPNFVQGVQATHNQLAWVTRAVAHHQRGAAIPPWSTQREQTPLGDETGVQGRWQQHINQVMSSVFLSQGLDVQMGDFRATTTKYDKVPDVAGSRRSNGQLVFVGELKTPWVEAHLLSIIRGEQELRRILGQLAGYMQDTSMVYGFISTYNKTIFLRQVPGAGNTWILEYSPVIEHGSASTDGGVTLHASGGAGPIPGHQPDGPVGGGILRRSVHKSSEQFLVEYKSRKCGSRTLDSKFQNPGGSRAGLKGRLANYVKFSIPANSRVN